MQRFGLGQTAQLGQMLDVVAFFVFWRLLCRTPSSSRRCEDERRRCILMHGNRCDATVHTPAAPAQTFLGYIVCMMALLFIKNLRRPVGLFVYVLPHCALLSLFQVFMTPQYLAIVMEYAPGGDLFAYVAQRRGLSEERARWFFQQLVVGLDYCHRRVRFWLFWLLIDVACCLLTG